jgi:hypothetical protein
MRVASSRTRRSTLDLEVAIGYPVLPRIEWQNWMINDYMVNEEDEGVRELKVHTGADSFRGGGTGVFGTVGYGRMDFYTYSTKGWGNHICSLYCQKRGAKKQSILL